MGLVYPLCFATFDLALLPDTPLRGLWLLDSARLGDCLFFACDVTSSPGLDDPGARRFRVCVVAVSGSFLPGDRSFRLRVVVLLGAFLCVVPPSASA